jgi:large repetitive protein
MSKYRFNSLLLLIAVVFSTKAFAQVHITENDTSLCFPQPFTLHATVDSGQTAVGLVIADDTYSDIIPLDFPFTFYGNTYNDMYLSTNAYIKFGGDGGYSPWVITQTDPFPTGTQSAGGGEMTNVIMGPWHDTYPGVGNSTQVDAMDYKTVGTAPNRIFVFSFCEVPMFSCTDLDFSGQILLFETTNIIEVHLNHKDVCETWNPTVDGGQAVLGLQDSTGQYATIVYNVDTQWYAENEAWRFTPTSDTSYAVDTILYGPIPIYSGGGVHWTDNGQPIGNGLSINIDTLSSGIHQIIAEVHGCYVSSAYDTITIVVGAPAIPDHTDVPCEQAANGSISITINNTAPYTAVWTDTGGNVLSDTTFVGSMTVTGLSAGDYSLLITDTAGCASTIDYTIDVVPNAAILDYDQQNVPCAAATNGSATVQLAAGSVFSVQWTDFDNNVVQMDTAVTDESTLASVGAGNYSVLVTDEYGCTSTHDFSIAIVPQPLSVNANIVDVACPESTKGSVTITLPNSNQYHALWTNEANGDTLDENDFTVTNALNNISFGNYNVLLTDANGCTFDFSYEVEAGTYTVDFTQDADTLCAGGIVDFSAVTNEDVTTYAWTFGDGEFAGLPNVTHQYDGSGNFTAQLTISNPTLGCTATASHPVFVRAVIDVSFTSTAPACVGVPVYFTDLSTASPASWEWNFGGQGNAADQNPQFAFNAPGTYTVSLHAVDAYCGEGDTSATITVNPFPTVDLEPDTSSICAGQSVSFDAGNPDDTYIWNNGAITQTIAPTFETSTWVSVAVSHLGCTISDSVYVNVACYLQMPNAFSPNGDGANDFFRPVGQNIITYELYVYNRWGQQVYGKTNVKPGASNEGWDGKINGVDAEIGSYSYFVKGTLLNSFVEEKSGNVILLR